MSNLSGNPYVDSDITYADTRMELAKATLALAYEQRTANLIALAQMMLNVDGPTGSLDEDLAIIFNRLGGGDTK